MNADKVGRSLLAVGLAASAMTMGLTQTAGAVGGKCSSVQQEKEDTGYNSFRVRAYCKSLNADSKAKGVLIRGAGNSDSETAWFTTLNAYRYSPYKTCSPLAPCQGTRVKLEHV